MNIVCLGEIHDLSPAEFYDIGQLVLGEDFIPMWDVTMRNAETGKLNMEFCISALEEADAIVIFGKFSGDIMFALGAALRDSYRRPRLIAFEWAADICNAILDGCKYKGEAVIVKSSIEVLKMLKKIISYCGCKDEAICSECVAASICDEYEYNRRERERAKGDGNA